MAEEKILHLTTEDFDGAIESGVTLVDFWAAWCRPCTMLAPFVEQIADEYDGKIQVAKVNIDEHEELAQRFGIMSIPMLILFKDGKPVDQSIGLVPKKEIAGMIDKHVN